MTGLRDAVPKEITVPCERTAAVVSVALAIGADPVRVYAPGLDELAVALPDGAADLIRAHCAMWTRWLARAGSGQLAGCS